MALTDGIGVKEANGRPENRGKHLVVKNTRGIDTDEVEQNSSSEAQQNGRHRAGRVDGYPLACG